MPKLSDDDVRRCITTPSGVNASKVALAASLVEARHERDEARAEVVRLRSALESISMMSAEAVLEEPDRAQRIAREALDATKPAKETP